MGQQAAGERGSSSSTDALLPPPVVPTASEASSATSGTWQTAAEVNQRTKRKRSFSADAPMWFGFGLLLCIWGGILTFDHHGPTTDLDARITEVDLSRSSKGGTSYSIEGVDSNGGEFDTDVSKDIYRSADRGERVVVSRAWLTGRVVSIDGGGWRHEGGSVVIIAALALVVGLVLLVCGTVSMRRHAAADENNPRPLRRVRVWLIVGAVLAAGWIVYERTQAAASSDADGSSASATIAPTTAPPAPGSVECTDLSSAMDSVMPSLAQLDSISAAQFEQVGDIVATVWQECSRASIERALCAEMTRAVAADPTLAVSTGGRCPGLP